MEGLCCHIPDPGSKLLRWQDSPQLRVLQTAGLGHVSADDASKTRQHQECNFDDWSRPVDDDLQQVTQ